MNNNEVRQVSDEEIRKELTKEQLQQTQVLNFQEVQRAIHFEKITSKKPAIFIAIIGLISILFGGSLQIAASLNATPKNIQKREVKSNVEVKKLNCIKTTLDNPDGTNVIYNVAYKFEDDRLVEVTKLYNISATAGKEEGKKSIEKYNNEYKNLLNETPGYDISISSTSNTTMVIKVIIYYKKLDLTKLNSIQQTKDFTKIDYNKNTSYKTIKSDSIEKGFTVE